MFSRMLIASRTTMKMQRYFASTKSASSGLTAMSRTSTLDASSRLAQLEQDGWRVEYLRYAEHDGYWLPERLKLHGPDIDITLVVKDWQARQLGQ